VHSRSHCDTWGANTSVALAHAADAFCSCGAAGTEFQSAAVYSLRLVDDPTEIDDNREAAFMRVASAIDEIIGAKLGVLCGGGAYNYSGQVVTQVSRSGFVGKS
jgi:hypothetical protein